MLSVHVADADQPFVDLDWDSQFFGRRIGRITTAIASRAALDDALGRARRAGCECLYYLVDPKALVVTDALESAGFTPIDVRITLEGHAGHDSALAATTRTATAADLPRLRDIASHSHHDARFYHDSRFARARCDAFYATWIERSVLHGLADHVLTIDADDGAAGYVTCKKEADGPGSIGLLAVAKYARGRGYGPKLLAGALDWFERQGIGRVRVVTQERNVAAQHLYRRHGFVPCDAKLWYHLWLHGEPSSAASGQR
jgi:dTDP-4-amino-4,6-dideoxy-D-galactose acyltransferase